MYPTIVYLASAYFHQDFSQLGDSPEAVLRGFCANEAPETIAELRQEIDDLLRGPNPAGVFARVWSAEAQSSYLPSLHGISYLEWAHRIIHIVDN